MATQKYYNPPQIPASGAGTFSDDLVGFQLVQGGGLTQGNFEFVETTREKQTRNFVTGIFSEPINLENLKIGTNFAYPFIFITYNKNPWLKNLQTAIFRQRC